MLAGKLVYRLRLVNTQTSAETRLFYALLSVFEMIIERAEQAERAEQVEQAELAERTERAEWAERA